MILNQFEQCVINCMNILKVKVLGVHFREVRVRKSVDFSQYVCMIMCVRFDRVHTAVNTWQGITVEISLPQLVFSHHLRELIETSKALTLDQPCQATLVIFPIHLSQQELGEDIRRTPSPPLPVWKRVTEQWGLFLVCCCCFLACVGHGLGTLVLIGYSSFKNQ